MENNTFKKRAGTTDKGKLYEDLMVADLILKLLMDDSINDFNMSSNDDQFGDFDDIVVDVESGHQQQTYALQLKHATTKGKTLTKSGLMESRGPFSIKKYHQGFQQLNNSANVKLILFTNLKFEVTNGEIIDPKSEDWDFKIKISKIPHEPLLNSHGGGRCYKFEVVDSTAVEYQHFFDIFFLYTNQASVDVIREDIARKFQEKFCCDRGIVKEYFDFIAEWSVREGKKMKLNKHFMRRAIAIRLLSPFIQPFSFADVAVSEQSQLLRAAISEFGVTVFDKDNCDRVRKIYGDTKGQINNINEINEIGKQYQVIPKNVKDVNELSDGEITLLLWLLGKCPLIVIANNITHEAINLCQDGRFVLLRDDSYEESLKNSKIFTNLTDLDSESETYGRILEIFRLSLQGKDTISLQTFIGHCEALRTLITTDELVQILDDSFTIGGEKELLPIEHVDRLVSNNIIDYAFLTQIKKDTLIVISCHGKVDKIKNYITSFNTIRVEDYLKLKEDRKSSSKNFERNIYISRGVCSRLQFDKICVKNPEAKNYHCLRVDDDGRLEWVRSKGGIADLDEYRCNGHFVEETKLFRLDTDDVIDIVCADAGMGKSTLAKNLKNHHSSTYWTVLVYVKEHSSYFDGTNRDVNDFIKYILNKTHKTQKKFDLTLLDILKYQNRIAFIWDGLDEIFNESLQSALDIIDQLSNKGFSQLITSRNNLRRVLENKFNVFSRTIKPFDEAQQNDYIKNRLRVKLSETELEDTIVKIKKYVEMAQYNDILGIPLQIFMLTELFRQDHEKYRNLLDEIFSIAHLYRHFVDEKFNIYYKEKGGLGEINDALKRIFEEHKKSQMKEFEKAALKAFFANEVQELNVDCEEFLTEIRENHDRFGFITEVTNEGLPNFLHNSYGEYFAATYLRNNHSKIPNLKEFIFDERYRNIRFLFDLLMAENCPVHIAVLCKNLGALLKYENQMDCKDQGGRNALQLACSWGEKSRILNTKNHIIDDTSGNSMKEESLEYQQILKVLSNKCDPYEVDDLFKVNAFWYADRSLCLLPIITLSSLYRVSFADLSNFKDISTVLYYSTKLDYSVVFDVIDRIPFVETKKEKYSLLHLSAKYNATNCLRKMLTIEKFRWRINDGNIYGSSPISVACSYGHVTIAQLLIDAEADVNVADNDGYTPLYQACKNGHANTVYLLIKSGTNLNTAAKDGRTPTWIASSNGNSEIVQILIDAKVNVNVADKKGYTPLYVACRNGHADIVQALLDCQANLSATAKSGHTPIYIAANKGHSEIVRLLINAKANVNGAESDNFSPLYLACQNGHADIVQLLIESQANVNCTSRDGRTPMWTACYKGRSEIVRTLINAKSDVNITDNYGWSPIYLACQNGHIDVVNQLIDAKTNLNVATKDGYTLIYIAAFNGYSAIVRLLIDAKADVNVPNNQGCSPLYVACRNGHIDVVNQLIDAKANLNVATKDGYTVIYIAAFNGYSAIVRLLIDAKADVNVPNNQGCSPLYVACRNGHVDVVRMLVDGGASVDQTSNDGRTPLYSACYNERSKIVRLLIDAKADVNANIRVYEAYIDYISTQ